MAFFRVSVGVVAKSDGGSVRRRSAYVRGTTFDEFDFFTVPGRFDTVAGKKQEVQCYQLLRKTACDMQVPTVETELIAQHTWHVLKCDICMDPEIPCYVGRLPSRMHVFTGLRSAEWVRTVDIFGMSMENRRYFHKWKPTNASEAAGTQPLEAPEVLAWRIL